MRPHEDPPRHGGREEDVWEEGSRGGPKRPRRAEVASGAEWSYRGKVVLAPMVRVGTLPFRILAQNYGADIVYSEELIDHRLLRCQRVVDEPLAAAGPVGAAGFASAWERPERTIRYVVKNDQKVKTGPERTVFQTYEGEPVVLQLGTGDAVRALQAAQVVARDVRAIDINMGCPIHFSVQGGMGAALLSKPEMMHDIVSTLKRNLNMPITVKIRLLEDERALTELGLRAEVRPLTACTAV
jgi:tRNA-dihydrouridine synthase 2